MAGAALFPIVVFIVEPNRCVNQCVEESCLLSVAGFKILSIQYGMTGLHNKLARTFVTKQFIHVSTSFWIQKLQVAEEKNISIQTP
jgi:hypothetical protein